MDPAIQFSHKHPHSASLHYQVHRWKGQTLLGEIMVCYDCLRFEPAAGAWLTQEEMFELSQFMEFVNHIRAR